MRKLQAKGLIYEGFAPQIGNNFAGFAAFAMNLP